MAGPTGGADDRTAADREIVALLDDLDRHDSSTADHARAVGGWCRRIAARLGLAAETVAFVEACGVLHDVGKLYTPKIILTKAGPLSASEWDRMRTHTADGAALLASRPLLARFAGPVYAHHERWDGAGYPAGTAGEDIPLAARIIATADAFHAMISERPYRPAVDAAEAFAELRRCSGAQFDALAVEALLAVAAPNSGDAVRARRSFEQR